MTFEGAVIREQGVTFAIVIVKKHIVDSSVESQRAIQAFQRYFPGMPLILMGQDSRGRATYRGRQDIVRFMARVPLSAVPWKQYTVN